MTLKILNREVNKNLHVSKLKKGQRGGEYKYLITSGATSHAAFRTKAGYNQYKKERGLKELKTGYDPKRFTKLKGKYEKISMGGTQKELDLKAKKEKLKPIKVLSNGQYIRGYLKKGKAGSKIYYMNPNYKPRKLKYVYK